jgi:hypothetical protein
LPFGGLYLQMDPRWSDPGSSYHAIITHRRRMLAYEASSI